MISLPTFIIALAIILPVLLIIRSINNRRYAAQRRRALALAIQTNHPAGRAFRQNVTPIKPWVDHRFDPKHRADPWQGARG